MNNTDHHDLIIGEAVVDHLIAVEMRSQAWCQVIPPWSHFGVLTKGFEFLLEPMDENRSGSW